MIKTLLLFFKNEKFLIFIKKMFGFKKNYFIYFYSYFKKELFC